MLLPHTESGRRVTACSGRQGRAEKSNDGKSIELSTSKREIAEENSPKYLMQWKDYTE